MSEILLSIIIPVYQRQNGLENLLDSLINTDAFEEYVDVVEVVIVDDASCVPVTVPEVPISHLIHMRNETNLGAPRSRELGFKHSCGSFIHFHDSDDAFSSGWLTGVMKAIHHSDNFDLLLTARHDVSKDGRQYRLQKYVHHHTNNIQKIKKRLLYRNCFGPLGGITFSRSVLRHVAFRNFTSCQDWQMYLDAIEHTQSVKSSPDITYDFHVDGSDRISNDATKKIHGFLQLSKITEKSTIFDRNIRLFYLHTCKQHIFKKQGLVKKFYDSHRIRIYLCFILITLYWRLS